MPDRDCRVVVYRDAEGGFRGEIEGLPGIVVRAWTIEDLRDEAIEAVVRSRGEEQPPHAGSASAPFVTMDIPTEHIA